jgi:hypothetical protein
MAESKQDDYSAEDAARDAALVAGLMAWDDCQRTDQENAACRLLAAYREALEEVMDIHGDPEPCADCEHTKCIYRRNVIAGTLELLAATK